MLEVMREKCNQCLFSNNRIVSAERKRDVLRECRQRDRYFVCHKSSANGGEVCCRGFYDKNPGATNLMRIMGRLHGIEFVDLPDADSKGRV